jgi:hypothetical protein
MAIKFNGPNGSQAELDGCPSFSFVAERATPFLVTASKTTTSSEFRDTPRTVLEWAYRI